MKGAATRIPVTTGGRLDDLLQEWALRHAQVKLGDYFNNAKVLFFSGMTNFKLATTMSEYTANMEFADPAAAARGAQAPDVARHAGALRQRRALRAGPGAAERDVVGAGQGMDEVRAAQGHAERDRHRGAGARTRRLRRRRAWRQDHRHLHRQRRADRAVQEEGRRHGDRRGAFDVRPRAGPQSPRCDDHRGDGQGSRTTSWRTITSKSSPVSNWSRASSTPTASGGSTASRSSSIRCRRSISRTSSRSRCSRMFRRRYSWTRWKRRWPMRRRSSTRR